MKISKIKQTPKNICHHYQINRRTMPRQASHRLLRHNRTLIDQLLETFLSPLHLTKFEEGSLLGPRIDNVPPHPIHARVVLAALSFNIAMLSRNILVTRPSQPRRLKIIPLLRPVEQYLELTDMHLKSNKSTPL